MTDNSKKNRVGSRAVACSVAVQESGRGDCGAIVYKCAYGHDVRAYEVCPDYAGNVGTITIITTVYRHRACDMNSAGYIKSI